MQVRATRGRKSVEAGLEISMGRLVLNYDVDKTSEDMSREIPTFRYRALSRVRILYAAGDSRSWAYMRIINVMRNTAVNSDQRKRAITRSAGKYGRVDKAIESGNLRIVAV